MNWTGGRRIKIQANTERMRQRQYFDRQRRLIVATYDQGPQQNPCVIPKGFQGRSNNLSTAKHRDSQHRGSEVKSEPDKGSKHKHSIQSSRHTKHDTITHSSLASSASMRSTRGDTEMVAQDFDLGIRDYDTSRKACLELLASPSFDLIGEPFHLRQSRLLEHKAAPPNSTTQRRRRTGKRSEQQEEVRPEYSYSADEEEEDEEDEPLQVPAKHRAVCQELRTKRGHIGVAEDVPMDYNCLTKLEPVNIDPSHTTDITAEKDQDITTQVGMSISNRVQMPEQGEAERPRRSASAQHQTNRPGETMQEKMVPVSLTQQQQNATTLQSVNPPITDCLAPAPSFAASSCTAKYLTPIDHPMNAAAEAPIQTTTQPPLETYPAVAKPQETAPMPKDLKKMEEIPDLPFMEIRVTAQQPKKGDPTAPAVDATGLQSTYPLTKKQPAIAPSARSQIHTTMALASHATATTEATPPPAELKSETQQIESSNPPSVSALRPTESPFFAHGSINLLERRHDCSLETTNVQELKHQPMKMYSQSIPSEMNVLLYSDEETPNQSKTFITTNNTDNNNIGGEDSVAGDEISPIVSTQHSFSQKSSLFSATPDWPPANQEAARRIALLQEHLLSSASTPSAPPFSYADHGVVQRRGSASTHTRHVNSTGHNYHMYNDDSNHVSNATPGSIQHPSLVEEQGPGQVQGYNPSIILPSDPEDTDALSPILDSQGFFTFGSGSGFAGRGHNSSSGDSTEAMRGVGNVYDPDIGDSADGAVSEWIGSEEWALFDDDHVDQKPSY